jgi:UDP-N-acetylmuramyl pentapeptide phosphotransferase/UDP-N-acetylglucosamine-1-phosphate transferase
MPFPVLLLLVFGVTLMASATVLKTRRWHGRYSTDSTYGVQKSHVADTPRIGGVAIVVGLVVAWYLASPSLGTILGPMLLAGSPAFMFGLAEDLCKQVAIAKRLLATMACGVLGWTLTGQAITNVSVPGLDWLLGFTVMSVAFTAFAVGGVANAINIIDGFNGLAAGTVIIILSTFALMCSALGDTDLMRLSLIVASAVLGFGFLNWPMGKIFLGDGGAYLLGFAVAWLAVLLLNRHPEVSAWAPLMVCGYPFLEVIYSILRRWRRRKSAGDADGLHLHSLLKRRVIRRLLPGASTLVHNSVTGSLMWVAALLPAAIALQFPTDTPALVLAFASYAFMYSAAYARLTQFRWCLSALTLRQQSLSVQ